MNDLHADLIHRYLDDSITRAEFETLQKELEHSETLRQEFVRVSLLHDLLSQELFEPNVVTPGPTQQFGLPQQPAPQPSSQRWKLIATWGPLASLILFFVGFLAFLPNPNRSQLFASQELSRILRSIPTADRLYGLDVETVALPNRIGRRGSETDRPPKPSLEGEIGRAHV